MTARSAPGVYARAYLEGTLSEKELGFYRQEKHDTRGLSAGQGKMTTRQQKKLDAEALKEIRDRFRLPVADAGCETLAFYTSPTPIPRRCGSHR